MSLYQKLNEISCSLRLFEALDNVQVDGGTITQGRASGGGNQIFKHFF